MTLVELIIDLEFWFEYGIAKFGFYISIANFVLMVTTLLTVKGIFFPVWGIIPVGVALASCIVIIGYFLDTRRIMGRLNSRMNTRGNPEFLKMIDDVNEIRRMVEEMKGNMKGEMGEMGERVNEKKTGWL